MHRFWGFLLIFANGCSFIFMHGAPEQHEKLADFDCVSGEAAPAADVTGAVVAGIYTAAVGAATAGSDDDEEYLFLTIPFAALTVLEVVAAVHGFSNARECEHAKYQLATRRLERDKARTAELQQLQLQFQAAQAGCAKDTDCKDARICVAGSCSDPPASTVVPTPAAPTASPAPP